MIYLRCRRPRWALLAIGLLLAASLSAGCAPSLSACGPGDLRVGMVTDDTGIDGSANALVWQGIERADRELSVCAQFIESRSEEDYRKNITALAEERFDLIVAPSPALAGAIQELAGHYPGIQFLLVDGILEQPSANVFGIIYRVDQAAFPAGYLAAAWADFENPADPWVGYVASRQNPSAEQYVAAFEAGVKYYNAQRGRSVGFRGVYLETSETLDSQEQANALIDLGIDVILEVDSATAGGALTMAKGRGKWGVGSDLDRYETLPDARDILLTSAVKRLDSAVYSFLVHRAQSGAGAGMVLVGTLENGGVGLAPYHDTEKQILAATKQQVADILQAISDGTLSTGWQAP